MHRVRSGWLHHSWDGEFQHTSIHFWCGSYGFLYEPGKRPRKHAAASLVDAPAAGRVVCATCQGRAIGAGQVQPPRIGSEVVKFKPRADFMVVKGDSHGR